MKVEVRARGAQPQAPTGDAQMGASGIEIRSKSSDPYYASQRTIAEIAPAVQPIAPTPEMGLGDVAMEGVKGLARGTLGLAQSIGGAGVEMAGQLGTGAYDALRSPQPFPGMTPEQWNEIQAGRAAQVPTQNPVEGHGARVADFYQADRPSLAADPRTSPESAPYLTTNWGVPQLARLAGEAGEMAPNAAATIGAAVATGGLGPAGAIAGGAMGGGLEGLSEYQQVLDEGGSPEDALRAASIMGAGAGALNAIPFVTYSTKFLPPSMRGTAARAMLSFIAEGSTETAEGGVSAIARMKSLPKSQEEWAEAYSKVERGIIDESNVFLVAGLMGGGTALAAGGGPTIPYAGPGGVAIGPDAASPVDRLEPGPNAPLQEPERFEEDYAPFDLPAQEQAPTAPSTAQQPEAIPEPIQAPDSAVAPSPEAVVAPEPEPELSESEKQAEADLLAEFPELKGMLNATRNLTPEKEALEQMILGADTVDSREIPKIEVRKPVSREESLSKLIEERPALDVGRPLDAAVRPEAEGVPQGPARVTVRAQDRPRPGERPTSAVPSPEVRATVRGPEPQSTAVALPNEEPVMEAESAAPELPAPKGEAEFVGLQERPRGQAPIALYNIPTPDGGKTTVTAETAKSQGFSVPEPPARPTTEDSSLVAPEPPYLPATQTQEPEAAVPTKHDPIPAEVESAIASKNITDAENKLQSLRPWGKTDPKTSPSIALYEKAKALAENKGWDWNAIEEEVRQKRQLNKDWFDSRQAQEYADLNRFRQQREGVQEKADAINAEVEATRKAEADAAQAKEDAARREKQAERNRQAEEEMNARREETENLAENLSQQAVDAYGKATSKKAKAHVVRMILTAMPEKARVPDEWVADALRSRLSGIVRPRPATQPVPTMTEEEYLASKGASRQGIGESALHKNIQEGRAKRQMIDRQAQRDRELIEKRDALRDEYRAKVESGEIREPTRQERLERTAQGHPDNEATQAAQRLLEKKATTQPQEPVQAQSPVRATEIAPDPEVAQKAAAPSAYSPETQAIIDIYGDKAKALAALRKQSATAAKNKETNPATEKAIKELTEGPAPQQDDLFGAEEIQTGQADAKQTQIHGGVEVIGKNVPAEYVTIPGNDALSDFRADVQRLGVKPGGRFTAEDLGYAGKNKPPWIRASGRYTADQWVEQAAAAGLIDAKDTGDSTALQRLMRGKQNQRIPVAPARVEVPGVNQKAPDTGKPSSVGDIMKGMGLTAEKSKRVKQADARIPKSKKSKKGKADDESGYVNMALFNPMEALRILRGKLKDGKFIEFAQGFMGLKDLKVARSGRIKSLQMRGKLIAQDFENAWRKEWQKQNPGVKAMTVRFRDMPAETVEALNDYLVEEDAGVKAQLLSELPEGLRRPATQMRDLVDQMSQELIDMGIVEDDVAQVIADQMGFYLRRTYAIFQDPKYRENIPKAVEDNARKWLREKFPTYTTNQIESALADLKGVGSEKEALNRLVQMGGVLGKLDRRTLGKRNEYDQAILDLWGVDKNGIDNFLNTINAQAHMIANFEWLEDIKANGRGTVVLTPQDIAALPQGDERAQWPFLNESDSRKAVSMLTRPKDPAASRKKALDKFIAKAESQGDAGTVEALKKTKALFEKGMKLEDGKEVVDSRNLEGASEYAEQLQAEADKLQAEGVAAPRGKKGPLKAKSRVAQSKANKINRQIKAILEAEEQKGNVEPDTFGPFGPLAGARVHPEFKAALQEAVQIQEVAPWIQKWNWFNRQLKQNVTTRDSASALRNFRSGVDFSMANGWMLYDAKNVPKRLMKALSIANVDIRRSHDPGLREEYLKMVEYGIAGDTAIVGELNEIQKEAKKAGFIKAAEKALSPELVKAMGGADALATKLYQAGDDVFKIFGALTEQEHLMEATGMDADAALKEAATRVRRQFPTYSEVHKSLQKLRRTPVIGPFVAYQSEVPRNAWNTIAQMSTEIKSDNPKVRAMGYRRAAGIMWATANRHAYKAAWLALLGLTPDDDDRIRKALPEYFQGHEFAITEGDKATGKYRGYNLSQADAYGPLKEPFWAALRGENIVDAAVKATEAFGGGYVSPELGTQAIVSVLTGTDARGKDLFLETDSPAEKTVKTLGHVLSQYAIPSPIRRQFKAKSEEEHALEVFGTLTGYRFIDIDLPTDLFWKAKDFKKYGTEQVRDAYTAARDGDTEAARKQLKDLEAVRKDYFDELQEAYIAFRDTGLNQEIMDAKLKEAGLSKKEIEAVKYGTLEPYTPPQKLTDMME